MNTSLFLQPAQPGSYPHSSSAPILPRQLQPLGANLIKASYVISTLLFYNILVNINYFIGKIKPPTRALSKYFYVIAFLFPWRSYSKKERSSASILRTNIPQSVSKAKFLGIYDPAKGFFLQRLLIKTKKSVDSFPKIFSITVTI